MPEEELAIGEINIGTYAFEAAELWSALDAVAEEGGERYLTGVFPVMLEAGRRVASHLTDDVSSALGVNSRVELMDAERLGQRRILEGHARAGVTFVAPESIARRGGRRDRRGHHDRPGHHAAWATRRSAPAA